VYNLGPTASPTSSRHTRTHIADDSRHRDAPSRFGTDNEAGGDGRDAASPPALNQPSSHPEPGDMLASIDIISTSAVTTASCVLPYSSGAGVLVVNGRRGVRSGSSTTSRFLHSCRPPSPFPSAAVSVACLPNRPDRPLLPLPNPEGERESPGLGLYCVLVLVAMLAVALIAVWHPRRPTSSDPASASTTTRTYASTNHHWSLTADHMLDQCLVN